MRLLCFIFLIFIKELYSSQYTLHKKTNGFDQRPQLPESDLVLITKFFAKKRLLDVLENPRVPLNSKIRMLPNPHTPTHPNIKAGGLLKNWSFDMEEDPVKKD